MNGERISHNEGSIHFASTLRTGTIPVAQRGEVAVVPPDSPDGGGKDVGDSLVQVPKYTLGSTGQPYLSWRRDWYRVNSKVTG